MEQRSIRKSQQLYQVINQSGSFYRNPVVPGFRSRMNVVFRLPSKELEQLFLREAEENGFVGLQGHRSLGGVRASLYNGVPESAVEALGDFMGEFLRKRG